MASKKGTTTVSARIPLTLKKLMEDYIHRDTHLNESDFVRSAIREKIEKDAPELLEGMFSKVVDRPRDPAKNPKEV